MSIVQEFVKANQRYAAKLRRRHRPSARLTDGGAAAQATPGGPQRRLDHGEPLADLAEPGRDLP